MSRPPGYRLLPIVLALWPAIASAHDPSAWGGLFRSRDHGGTWIAATEGRFVSGALALAISPTDVNQVLLGTDSGLLRTLNGGRDWQTETPSVFAGPVFAVAFHADGVGGLASTGLGIFRTDDGVAWRSIGAPDGAFPVRAIVRGAGAGRAYLAGSQGLWRTDDWGHAWTDVVEGLPPAPVTAVLVRPGPPEAVLVVCGGRLWASRDGGGTWSERDRGLPAGAVEAIATDPGRLDRIWAAGADQVHRSDDGGATWHPIGAPLDETGAVIRGVAADADGHAIVLTTHRGIYRSVDDGRAWELSIDALPGHMEAGPLLRDLVDPRTLYAGFSLTPYDELRRMAVTGESLLARLDAASVAGGVAFLVLLVLSGVAAVRWLTRSRSSRLQAVPHVGDQPR